MANRDRRITMANASSVIKMLQGNYQLVGLNVDDTFKKTDMLLKLYRKVCWSMGEHFEELNAI